jgi:hypothetical protein
MPLSSRHRAVAPDHRLPRRQLMRWCGLTLVAARLRRRPRPRRLGPVGGRHLAHRGRLSRRVARPTRWPACSPKPCATAWARWWSRTSPAPPGGWPSVPSRPPGPTGRPCCWVPSGPMVMFPHVYKKLEYHAVKDFTPVSLLARFQFGIVSGPATGTKSIAELIAQAKARPDSATYASPGQGTAPHFLGVMLEQAMGVPFLQVPYQVRCAGQHRAAGRACGLQDRRRQRDGRAAPQRQGARDRGHRQRTRQPGAGSADPARAGHPDGDQRLVRPLRTGRPAGGCTGPAREGGRRRAVRSPALREKLLKLGYTPVGSTGAELAAAQQKDLASWEKPIRSTGIALD